MIGTIFLANYFTICNGVISGASSLFYGPLLTSLLLCINHNMSTSKRFSGYLTKRKWICSNTTPLNSKK